MNLDINELYAEGFITKGQRDSIVMMYGDEVDNAMNDDYWKRVAKEKIESHSNSKTATDTDHLYDGEVRKLMDNKEESSGKQYTRDEALSKIAMDKAFNHIKDEVYVGITHIKVPDKLGRYWIFDIDSEGYAIR